MTENNANQLLERDAQEHNQSLEQLVQRHDEMLIEFNRRQTELLDQLRTQSRPKKDLWDRLGAMAPITSAIIIACTGAYFTFSYNQQQIKLQEIQTIEKFFPHLVGDEKSKRAAILAMNSLGNAKLAAKVASIFASEGTASALTSMARTSTDEDKETVRDALYRTLDALAERYKSENQPENALETYKKAVALKETMIGKDNPNLADSLDRLADLCEAHGDHASAEEARARSKSIKRRMPPDAANAASAAPVDDQNYDSTLMPGRTARSSESSIKDEPHGSDLIRTAPEARNEN